MMQEELLHFVWKFSLLDLTRLRTTSGYKIDVLDKGRHNPDAGPDFLDARLKIGGTLWAGNIEVHLKSSDWYSHKHHEDTFYHSVVLHIVFDHDKEIFLPGGELIHTLELKNRLPRGILRNYSKLLESKTWIPCEHQVDGVDKIVIEKWLERLLIERIIEKSIPMRKSLMNNNYHWNETFYHFLARSFGLKINAFPFILLAKSLPLKILSRHKRSLFQVEALLFGQAGLLDKKFRDEYPVRLKNEYDFLKKKYHLRPLDGHMWKFLRLRPRDFPTVRIAQFAALIHGATHLFSRVMEQNNERQLKSLFDVYASSYWDTHFIFDKQSVNTRKRTGRQKVNVILINTIVPFFFLFGELKEKPQFKQKALNLLAEMPPEDNSIIRKWAGLNIIADSSYHTQGLLQLKKQYCDKKKCLRCSIGNRILRKTGL